jgi:hypothetical protein
MRSVPFSNHRPQIRSLELAARRCAQILGLLPGGKRQHSGRIPDSADDWTVLGGRAFRNLQTFTATKDMIRLSAAQERSREVLGALVAFEEEFERLVRDNEINQG